VTFENIYHNASVFLVQLKVGSITTVLHVGFLLLAINTWGYAFFELNEFPDWARNGKWEVLGRASNGTLTNGTLSLLNVTADTH